MAFVSWLTSNSLIAAVQRKISMPLAQGLMSEQDILDFATEELLISQVPSVLQYHEEYFVWQEEVPLVAGKTKYAIPERAIGMKLRDIWFKDTNGSLSPMTRIAPEDKDTFQRDSAGSSNVQKYYLQGNYVVLTDNNSSASGSLQVEYFLRPSRLVPDERAAYIESFFKRITVVNASLVSGDTVTIDGTVFIADTDFAIGVDSATTAANLASAIVNAGIVLSTTADAGVVSVYYEALDTIFSVSNSSGTTINAIQGVQFTAALPANITNGADVDFLQTRPGHSLRGKDITIPTSGLSTDTIVFTEGDVPEETEVGDYLVLSGEAIIPQIPTDLHTALADRTCVRILAAIGDQAGVESMNQKLSETELRQGTLLNNRVEGSLPKVVARNSLLRLGKIGNRRGF